ncbi:MAG: hypothetical protein RL747_1270 [Bacteroidota bacterium]|jgi:hypothetical protein
MFLYPFKTAFIQTSLNRAEVSAALIKQTFLTDEDFQKTEGQQMIFFGEVSQQDFTLESIAQEKPIVNFCTGEIRGSENEIYILLQLGAWQHRRIFLLFALLILACTAFYIHHLWLFNALYPKTIAASLLLTTIIALVTTLYIKARNFHQRTQPTLDHFNTLWQGKTITKSEVPLIFR